MLRAGPLASAALVALGVAAALAGPASWRALTASDAPPALPPATSPALDATPLAEHADDVVDYTLRARLDATRHTVHGEGTIRFRNASAAPVRELWLHLYLNAFKNDLSTFAREPSTGYRGSAVLTDHGTIDLVTLSLRPATGDAGAATDLLPGLELHRTDDTGATDDDETDARVPLPREVLPGQAITLDVAWDDKLPALVFRTGYAGSFHFAGQWFPKLARLEPDGTWAHFPFHRMAEFYADFGTYDVTLDVPESFLVGATGPVVESHFEGGRLLDRHVQADVHDFAWTAWDGFRWRDEDVGGVKVRVLFPEGFEADAERELTAVRFALPYFGRLYGRYPYPWLTVVHPPESASEAGGMEYPTLITTGGAWYGAPLSHLIELVTVHELGHQYFYGLVATNEVLWPFLDEGVNSYAEADVLHAMFGHGSVVDAPGFTVSDHAVQAIFGNASAHEGRVAQPAYAFSTGKLYNELVYERTAVILETLRRVYGDAAMSRSLGAYARAFRFQHPGPQDFIRSFNDGMGGEAAATLRRALFDKGWVDFAVVEVESRPTAAPRGMFDEGGKRTTVRDAPVSPGGFEGWVLVERHGTLELPVEVELTLEDGTRQRVSWDGQGDSVRIPYRGASALRAAVVDPDHAVLLDDDLTNNHALAAEADREGAPRVLERATYWGELLVQGLGP
jgi:hypothetical protein